MNKILEYTYDSDSRREDIALWNYFDSVFDETVRCNTLIDGLDLIYESIEDFCTFYKIKNIPALYKTIFDRRGGFFTQSKFALEIRDEWIQRFPNELILDPNINDKVIQNYKKYLQENQLNFSLDLLEQYLQIYSESD